MVNVNVVPSIPGEYEKLHLPEADEMGVDGVIHVLQLLGLASVRRTAVRFFQLLSHRRSMPGIAHETRTHSERLQQLQKHRTLPTYLVVVFQEGCDLCGRFRFRFVE